MRGVVSSWVYVSCGVSRAGHQLVGVGVACYFGFVVMSVIPHLAFGQTVYVIYEVHTGGLRRG